jgi:hypothetical protein
LIQEGCKRADARNEDLLSFETSRLISNLYIVLESLREACAEAYDLTNEEEFWRNYIEYRRQELGILKIKISQDPTEIEGRLRFGQSQYAAIDRKLCAELGIAMPQAVE